MPPPFVTHLDDICGLLLRPTAENVSQAAVRLESVAEEIAQVRKLLIAGEIDKDAAIALLTAVRAKTLRAGDLLNSAARFYSALSTTTDFAGYERHGCMCMMPGPRRQLAQM